MFIFGRTAEARQVDTAAPRPAGSPSANLVFAVGMPKALDPERGRQRPEAILRNFLDSRDDALDLIVCDGPGASEVEAASVFEYANAIVALDGAEEAATLEQLAGLGFARRPRANRNARSGDAQDRLRITV